MAKPSLLDLERNGFKTISEYGLVGMEKKMLGLDPLVKGRHYREVATGQLKAKPAALHFALGAVARNEYMQALGSHAHLHDAKPKLTDTNSPVPFDVWNTDNWWQIDD